MKNTTGAKKLLISLVFLILPFTANAAGPYDGAWELILPGVSGIYFTVNQNGNVMAVITLDSNNGNWSAYQGETEGTQATLSTVISFYNTELIYAVDFTSLTTATVIQVSCTPVAACENELPDDIPFSAEKIF